MAPSPPDQCQPEVAQARPLTASTSTTLNVPTTEKRANSSSGRREKSYSLSSNGNTLTSIEEHAAHRAVRTTPTWVFPLDEDEEDAQATSRLLPGPPTGAQLAQHNHTPSATHDHGPRLNPTDDVGQDWRPESVDSFADETESRWKTFARVSAHPPAAQDRVERVTEEWLQEHGPDYSRPWHVSAEDPEKAGQSHKAKRKAWWKRFQHTILRNPMVPLFIRLTLWSFSLIAMALAITIRNASVNTSIRDGPSTIMAISIDAVALVYILYITWDEYTGKPLGLRSAKAKMRLIFLDLFFIVFDSANLSLAFETISNVQGPCREGEVDGLLSPRNREICARQKALASVLLVALIAWLMAFSISVLRYLFHWIQRAAAHTNSSKRVIERVVH